MAILSQRAYARHRGVALYAVQMAIKKGRISTTPEGQIDSAVADREWEANTRKDPPKVKVKVNSRRPAEDDSDPSGESFSVSQYTKARAIREHFQARLAQIDYQERTGELVRASEVKITAFNQYRILRDRLLAIPDRLGAMLAAESDPGKCHAIIAQELRMALNDFADIIGGLKGAPQN